MTPEEDSNFALDTQNLKKDLFLSSSLQIFLLQIKSLTHFWLHFSNLFIENLMFLIKD